MTRAALEALMSHWRRRPGQLMVLILGLALATGLWTAVQAINSEARASYARASGFLAAGVHEEIVSPTGEIALKDYVALRRSGWLVAPVVEGRARVGGLRVTVMGIDPLSYPSLPVTGSAETSPDEILLPRDLLYAHPETAARLRDVPPDLPEIRTSEGIPQGIVMADISLAERLLERSGRLSRLIVLHDQPMRRAALAEIAPELSLRGLEDRADTASLTDSFHLNLTAFGLLSFAVGLFIVHGTIGLAFEQRRVMIRTLRALGVPLALLVKLLLVEFLLLGLVGGLLGLVLGYLVAGALLPDVAATLRGLYGAEVGGSLTVRPTWVVAGLAISVVGVLLAGSQALWRLSRLPLLSLAGARAWAGTGGTERRWQIAAALVMFVGGISAVTFFDGLLAGFVFLGGVLLGAALLVPTILSGLLGILSRWARRPVAEWLWADTRSQLPGLSLALMALLLALATNIGVGTMVASFRLTFIGWLDQRLSSELYVTARDDVQGAALGDWLQDRADAVLPIRHVDIPLAGRPGRVYGIVDHQTYRQNWPLIEAAPDVWDAVMEGQAILINEQLARRANLWSGTSMALAGDWEMPIAGVYSDYGNPEGQVIVALDRLLDRFDAVPERRFGIRTSDPETLSARIRDTFDLPAGALVDQKEIKAQSLRIFDKTFIVTGALNILTLGVAAFAILTSLLTLWTMRLPQLAPVWALGLTRARLARLELFRSIALALLTALLALPLGLTLAWALLAVINVEAFGWRLPMFIFPLDWLVLVAAAIAAAALAATLPALRLRRTPPSELLKVFADER